MVYGPAEASAAVPLRVAASALDEAAYRDAGDNRSLTAGIAGTCVAILTFVLFFLYPMWQARTVNNFLFQATLFDIVAALFLISLASMNFWFVMESIRSNPMRTPWHFRQAELFFSFGFILFLLEPTMILATVQLYYAGAFSFGLWLVVLLSLGRGWRSARVKPQTSSGASIPEAAPSSYR